MLGLSTEYTMYVQAEQWILSVGITALWMDIVADVLGVLGSSNH